MANQVLLVLLTAFNEHTHEWTCCLMIHSSGTGLEKWLFGCEITVRDQVPGRPK